MKKALCLLICCMFLIGISGCNKKSQISLDNTVFTCSACSRNVRDPSLPCPYCGETEIKTNNVEEQINTNSFESSLETPNYTLHNYSNLGFKDWGECTEWIAIDSYDFLKNHVYCYTLNKVTFHDQYYIIEKYSADMQLEQDSVTTFSVVDNDIARTTSNFLNNTLRIKERLVDPQYGAVIYTIEQTSSYDNSTSDFMLIPYTMIDWSLSPKVTYDDQNRFNGYYLYLK